MPKKYNLSDLEKKAWNFAKEAHKGVTRKFSGAPYFEHVRKVFKLVKKVDTRGILGAASILHDTIEDVDDVTYEVLVDQFGKEVADLVKELTSDGELLDAMGKPDYLLDKMATMSNDALTIKLCDRLQNLSDHFAASAKFRENYYKETKYIIDNLRSHRQLTRSQMTVADQIDGIIKMMGKRYKLVKFESFMNDLKNNIL